MTDFNRSACRGVLFLDELPESHPRSLEVLRQPLERGQVTISRALRSTTFPARFVMVAALNLYPCSYRGDPRLRCNVRECPDQESNLERQFRGCSK